MADGPVILALFDGWGYRPDRLGNLVAEAETPNYDQLWEAYPHVLLEAAGAAVGLSEGTVGNAEAGYATLSAGRAVEQDSLRIDRAIQSGAFRDNPALREAAARVRATDARLHLLGLVSDGQIHSSERHYFELLALLQDAGVPGDKVFIHAILDGYDTPPRTGLNYLASFAAQMLRTGIGRVATLMGRSYGMAAGGGWETTERCYNALVHGAGRLVPSAIQAIQAGYSRGEEDSSLSPATVLGSNGLPLGPLADGDALVCFNHRGTGLERLLRALLQDDFDGFVREDRPALEVLTLTEYDFADPLGCRPAFPAPPAWPSLGRRLLDAGRRLGLVCESCMESQVRRLAADLPDDQVRWHVIPSPPLEQVIEHPERVVEPLTAAALELLNSGEVDVTLVDYVNADLAGHFGHVEAARRAVESLDAALPPLVRAARAAGASMLLTSCYGNVEELGLPETMRPNRAHTTNRVPLIVIDDRYKGQRVGGGGYSLADLAPTVLGLLGVPTPGDLAGVDLNSRLERAEPADEEATTTTLDVTAVEAVGMGIDIARTARDYYLAAAAVASDPESGGVYRLLAGEEERRLSGLQRRFELLAGGDGDLPVRPSAPPDLPDVRLSPLQVLEMAISEELETYRILTELAARNVDAQGTAVFEQLAHEEIEFLARLQRMAESEAIRLLSSLPQSGATP